MANPLFPFLPGVEGTGGVDLEGALAPVAKNVGAFMGDPRGQAAAMQFGINLMGVPAWGSTPFSNFATALGGAGEAVGREEALQRKDVESETKAQLAESRAKSAESLATARSADARSAADRLDFQMSKQRALEENRAVGRQLQANTAYSLYQKREQDRAKAVALTDPEQSRRILEGIQSREDYYRDRGFSDLLGGQGAAPRTGTPAQAPRTSSGGPTGPKFDAAPNGATAISPDGLEKWVKINGTWTKATAAAPTEQGGD